MLLGLGGRWVQTSFNGRIRGRFAGPGMHYDAELDLFVLPETEGSIEGEDRA